MNGEVRDTRRVVRKSANRLNFYVSKGNSRLIPRAGSYITVSHDPHITDIKVHYFPEKIFLTNPSTRLKDLYERKQPTTK